MRGFKLLIFVLLALIATTTYADNVCHIEGGGILDNLVTSFGNAAKGWETQISPLAKRIFYVLFFLEFMWQLIIKKIFSGDIEKLWVFFFTRTVLGFFFAHYLVDVNFYQAAITSIAHIGTNLGGYVLNITPGNNFNSFGPSEVIGHFSCLADSIHVITDDTGAFQYITTKFTLSIIQVLLFIILAFIAYTLMKTIIQTYFLLYVGFFLTGFAGSSWTASYWEKYVSALSEMAIKFLSISLLMGVVKVQMASWANIINAANDDIYKLSAAVIQILGSSFIIALIVYQLPEWAASRLNGSIKLRYGSEVSGFMSGGNSSSNSKSKTSATLNATALSHNENKNSPNLSNKDMSGSLKNNATLGSVSPHKPDTSGAAKPQQKTSFLNKNFR